MLRKGYAMPSLAADSAARIRRRFVGTCLIAYLPPVSSGIECVDGGRESGGEGRTDDCGAYNWVGWG